MTRLIAIYPAWWRARYGDEMASLLEGRPLGLADRVDLARGALDAWLHPPRRSWLPPLAAIVGGGLWTVAGAGSSSQPAPPDWPGYVMDAVPVAFAGALAIAVAILGFAMRAADRSRRAIAIAAAISVVGYTSWALALLGTYAGTIDSVTLGLTQTIAIVGTAAIGVVVGRAGHEGPATVVLLAAAAMLAPWGPMFLAFGAGFTALGLISIVERSTGRWLSIGDA